MNRGVLRKAILAFGVCALWLSAGASSKAGTTGNLRGYVVSSDYRLANGSFQNYPYIDRTTFHAAPSVEIEIFSPSTGLVRRRADKNGFFAFLALPPGRYILFVPRQSDQFGLVYGYCPGTAYVRADQTTRSDVYIDHRWLLVRCIRREPSNGWGGVFDEDRPFDVYEFNDFANDWPRQVQIR
jgi:hypothetical protein